MSRECSNVLFLLAVAPAACFVIALYASRAKASRPPKASSTAVRQPARPLEAPRPAATAAASSPMLPEGPLGQWCSWAVSLAEAYADTCDRGGLCELSSYDTGRGLPVYLHVYDVSQDSGISWINAVLAHPQSPFKFGGFFHTGVEVGAQEWSFGYRLRGSGVCASAPRQHSQHTFRETVFMGRTFAHPAEVRSILKALSEAYQGPEYDLLHRNCCHFAEELCQRLGIGSIPPWVRRLADVGGSFLAASKTLEASAGAVRLSCSVASVQDAAAVTSLPPHAVRAR